VKDDTFDDAPNALLVDDTAVHLEATLVGRHSRDTIGDEHEEVVGVGYTRVLRLRLYHVHLTRLPVLVTRLKEQLQYIWDILIQTNQYIFSVSDSTK
jgi:hypothetical protein